MMRNREELFPGWATLAGVSEELELAEVII